MSKYTTEVRFICEESSGLKNSKGYSDVDTILTHACPKIFDFDFPIFNEDYRIVLEKKILKHYYVREICCETVGLWKLYLSTRLNEIMPYYNKLYESLDIKYNPINDVDLTIDHNFTNIKNGNDATTGTVSDAGHKNDAIDDAVTRDADNTITTRDKYSDTPQGALTGIENDSYLTSARKVVENDVIDEDDTLHRTVNTTNDNTRTYNTRNDNVLNTTEDYIEHIFGKRGSTSYAKMMMEYRDSLINVDLMVINALSDLFMGLW